MQNTLKNIKIIFIFILHKNKIKKYIQNTLTKKGQKIRSNFNLKIGRQTKIIIKITQTMDDFLRIWRVIIYFIQNYSKK
jgi:hypothetical protein